MPTRSIKGLVRILKAEGFAISPTTVRKWHHEEGWEARAAAGEKPATISTSSTMVREEARKLAILDFTDAEKVESTVSTLAALTSGLAKVAIAHLGTIAEDPKIPVDTVLAIARASADVSKALAALAQISAPPPAEESPTALRGMHPLAPVLDFDTVYAPRK